MFVRLDSSDVMGMAHLTECSNSFIKHLTDHYGPGDPVKALVIKVDKELHRISLGSRQVILKVIRAVSLMRTPLKIAIVHHTKTMGA